MKTKAGAWTLGSAKLSPYLKRISAAALRGLSVITTMPLFSWMKWSNETKVQAQNDVSSHKTSGVVPSCMLIGELLRHMEDREQLAREVEQKQWFQKFHEVVATNSIRPWEMESVFRQVLKDFLNQIYDGEKDDHSVQPTPRRPGEAWPSRYQIMQRHVTPAVPNCGAHLREEIPTISGYVDWTMQHSTSFTANRDWELSYYYPLSLRPNGAYSTIL